MAEMLSTDQGIEVVAEAGDGREAVDLARKHRPDVVILDVEMPVMGGQVALRKLLTLSPPPKVVIVTVFADESHVRELLALGASAYLSKNASIRNLISTVCSVAGGDRKGRDVGNVFLSVPRDALGGTHEVTREENRPAGGPSPREMQVLLHAARGKSNREIGEVLYLSETTVKRHLSRVYEKLGVRSRGEATSKALAEGWFSPWDVTREEEPGSDEGG
jgi:DNA-binding NarL/FixJ family response regulator